MAHTNGLAGVSCCPSPEVCAKKIHRGYKVSLAKCRGFEYKKEDEEDVLKAYLADPVETNLPGHLRRRAKKIGENEAGTMPNMV